MNKPATRDYLAVSLFWLAVSFFWGAMLFVVLQSRVQEIVKVELLSLGRVLTERQIEAEVVARLGWMLAAGALVAAASQLLFGAVSDNFAHRLGRRKPFLIAGVLLANFGIVMLPFVHSYAAMLGVFLFIQLCLNAASGPYQALLPEKIPSEYHGSAAAYMGLFQLVGRTGGMVLGALLMRYDFGLTAMMILFVLMLNGLMLASVVLLREEPSVVAAGTREGRFGPVLQSLRSLWHTDLKSYPSFVWLLVSRFVINTGIYTMMPLLQYYLINTFGLSRNEALEKQALLGLVVNLTGMAGTFPAGHASDRWSKKRVVYVTCAICVAGGLGFALSGSVGAAVVSAAVFGLGYGAFQAVDWALVCNVLPDEEPAKYMGVWSFADTIPQIVAPLIGGILTTWAIAR
ncbi:MAG TPA: MFS transporter, partial [Abditibacteriaceae bacterium]